VIEIIVFVELEMAEDLGMEGGLFIGQRRMEREYHTRHQYCFGPSVVPTN
jgi:hypothetical protein